MKTGWFLAILLLVSAAVPARAGEQDAAALKAYCSEQPNMKPGMCDCLLRQFGKLTEGQQAFLAAMLQMDASKLAALRGQLSPAEADQAESFLARETMLCRPSG